MKDPQQAIRNIRTSLQRELADLEKKRRSLEEEFEALHQACSHPKATRYTNMNSEAFRDCPDCGHSW